MAKVIKINADGTQQEYAGVNTSAGVGSAGELVALDSSGKIDATMMPPGIGSDAITATAGESLTAGNFVYINGSGQVMKADATSLAKKACGYVLTAVSNAAQATVYFDDNNTALTGLTPGATYYLSATAGQATTTAPIGTGQIVQVLGIASSATSLHVNIDQNPVVRA